MGSPWRPSASCILRSPEGQGSAIGLRSDTFGLRPDGPRPRGKERHRVVVRASSEGSWKPPTRSPPSDSFAWGGLTRPGGSRSSRSRARRSCGREGSCSDLRIRAGRGSEVQEEESSGGAGSPGEQRPEATGRLAAFANGLREGSKASKQVKLAERGDSAVRCPGRPGSGLEPAERESIAFGGSRRLRVSAGVGETGWRTASCDAPLHAGG